MGTNGGHFELRLTRSFIYMSFPCKARTQSNLINDQATVVVLPSALPPKCFAFLSARSGRLKRSVAAGNLHSGRGVQMLLNMEMRHDRRIGYQESSNHVVGCGGVVARFAALVVGVSGGWSRWCIVGGVDASHMRP